MDKTPHKSRAAQQTVASDVDKNFLYLTATASALAVFLVLKLLGVAPRFELRAEGLYPPPNISENWREGMAQSLGWMDFGIGQR